MLACPGKANGSRLLGYHTGAFVPGDRHQGRPLGDGGPGITPFWGPRLLAKGTRNSWLDPTRRVLYSSPNSASQSRRYSAVGSTAPSLEGWSSCRGSPTASSLEERAPPFPLPPLPLANGGDGEGINSTKLAAGLRSVARNYKATRLLTRPG
jgi:hypothetical protein